VQTAQANSVEDGPTRRGDVPAISRVGTALMTVEPMSGEVDHSAERELDPVHILCSEGLRMHPLETLRADRLHLVGHGVASLVAELHGWLKGQTAVAGGHRYHDGEIVRQPAGQRGTDDDCGAQTSLFPAQLGIEVGPPHLPRSDPRHHSTTATSVSAIEAESA
jgi:hypothetical protein